MTCDPFFSHQAKAAAHLAKGRSERERGRERERENEERYLKDFLEHFHSTMFPELSYHKLS